MKRYYNIVFLFLLILSSPVFSQVSKWRSDPPQNNSSSQQKSISSDNISSWRVNPPRDNRNYVVIPNNNWDYLRFNRWNGWGAPFGFDYWLPYRYYNDWGYREPARIYIYDNGKRDTIVGKKTHFSFGTQYNTRSEVGAWITIGNKIYFILDASKSHKKDNSTYFPNGNLSIVDFPLVDDFIKTNSLYFGLGKKFNRTGIHLMYGINNEIVRWRGKDAIGFITFPKQENRYFGVKVGVIHDLKNVTFKTDVDPIIPSLSMGLGLNF
jgi:hypothetical protein